MLEGQAFVIHHDVIVLSTTNREEVREGNLHDLSVFE
jgi:hypothetical protein